MSVLQHPHVLNLLEVVEACGILLAHTCLLQPTAHMHIAVLADGLDVSGNVQMTGGSSHALNVQVNSTFQAPSTFMNSATFQAPLQLLGNFNMAPNATLNISGTAFLGSTMTDSLHVNAAATFNSPVSFASSVHFPPGTMLNASSDTAIGSSSDDQLTVNAAAVFLSALQAEDEVQIGGLLAVSGDTVLGNSSSDSCMLHCAASFLGPVDLHGVNSSPYSSAVVGFQRSLGGLPVSNGTVLGKVLFSGWDGVASGAGAQIRSVYTVSGSVLWPVASSCCYIQHANHHNNSNTQKTHQPRPGACGVRLVRLCLLHLACLHTAVVHLWHSFISRKL